MTPAIAELATLQDESTAPLARLLRPLAYAAVRGWVDREAEKKLGAALGETMALADLLGRRRLALEVEHAGRSYALVPHEQAIDTILQRHPVVAQGWEAARDAWEARGYALARAASETVARRVRQTITRAMREGTPHELVVSRIVRALRQGDPNGPVWGYTRAYAGVVLRTNLASAYSDGRLAHARDPQSGVRALRFAATLDPDTRPNHRAAHGLTAAPDDPVWHLLRPPLGYQCFPGSTVVQGRVQAVSRMVYAGQVCQVALESGRRLTLTPNHEVLTVKGLVRARALHPGDHCLSYVGEARSRARRPTGEVNEHNEPPTAEELFRAFAQGGHVTRIGVVANDLNGDAKFGNGEIEVVAAPGVFLVCRDAKQQEGVAQIAGVGSGSPANVAAHVEGSGRLGQLSLAPLASAYRVVGSGDLLSAGLWSHGRPLDFFGVGPASRLDSPCLEPAAHHRPRDAALVSQGLLALPGQVVTDKVVNVRWEWMAGHVYDLQTSTGWIVANDIYISNCRCALALALDVRSVRRARAPRGARPDAGFRHYVAAAS